MTSPSFKCNFKKYIVVIPLAIFPYFIVQDSKIVGHQQSSQIKFNLVAHLGHNEPTPINVP
jgi:hypothetical protein